MSSPAITKDNLPPPLAEAVRRLVEAYQPEAIWLFGSHARGDAGPDSDYDLMVIVPDDAPRERRQSHRAYPLLWRVGIAVDVLVSRKSDFYKKLQIVSSLQRTITQEGRILYAA